MKKTIRIFLVLLVCLLAAFSFGCGDNNATYDDDAKIAGSGDSSSTSSSSMYIFGDDFTQTAVITGTRTIWRYKADHDFDLTISYLLSVSEGGKAKLVLISPDDKVTTIIENADNTVYDEMKTKSIALKKGVNRIKIVGQEKPKFELKLHIEEGRYITDRDSDRDD